MFHIKYTTSDKVRRIIGWTLVCVSIHLECWLDKVRVEIVTWAAVDVACQQQIQLQFGFKVFGNVKGVLDSSLRCITTTWVLH